MEGVSPPPSPEEQRERHRRQQQAEEEEDDDDAGGTHVLVTLEPDEEDFPAPAGDEISVVIVKDPGASPGRGGADLSMGVCGDASPRGPSFYPPFQDADGMGRKGEALRSLREEAGIYAHLAHARPCFRSHEDEAQDEQNPCVGGPILAKPHRRDLCSKDKENVELIKITSMLPNRFQGMADIRSLNASSSASWECLTLMAKDGGPQEERLSQRTYGCREFQVASLPCPREMPFSVDSRIASAVKLSTELTESDPEDLLSEVPPETYTASARVQAVCREEKYLKVEPRPHETFHPELIEKSRQSIQRFEWVPESGESLSPTSKEKSKPIDIGMGISVRGPTVRSDPPPITLPVLRKTLNPGLNKTITLESGLSHRKALGLETNLNELALKQTTDWMLQKPNLQTSADLPGVKCSWTVNADDLVEQIPPSSLEVTSCSNYDAEMRPYMCDMLLGKRSKEDLVEEEDASVYTCIECSIYFKKKEHLLDHMLQHSQAPDQEQERDILAVTCHFSCNECGWTFRDSLSLEQHSRLHQESREKIIEEIQKLNEFSDEGREARLQCPKCIFGTNSSKVFVQHAKMHVRERKDQGVKSMSLFGNAGGKMHEAPVTQIYTHFQPNELPPSPSSQVQAYGGVGSSKSLSTCFLCGFPAPNEDILKEHMKYSHSNLSWDVEAFKEDTSQPGTSRDAYVPRPRTFSEPDYFGQAERLLSPPQQKSPNRYEPKHSFSMGHSRLEKNESNKKTLQIPKFQARKQTLYGSKQKKLGANPLGPAKTYSSQMGLKMKKRGPGHPRGLCGENRSRPQGTLVDVWRSWSSENNHGNRGEGRAVGSDIVRAKKMVHSKRFVVPQSALDVKRCFRDTLRLADPSAMSKRQQHQLRNMVPIVLLKALNLCHKKRKAQHGKMFKRKAAAEAGPPRDALLDENYPLDFLFRDPQLEGSLIPDDLLDPDSLILRNEERKCPYCPDRFHNGIGLANHVRGHLNRVGVNYNVRHFISAEEVKAIEQKFSFQKKKKKVANFDPATFSLMRCEFCGAGFDTRAGLSSHARAHLRDFGITNWELTISPINILKELLANSPDRTLLRSPPGGGSAPSSPRREREASGYGRKSTASVSECSLPRSPLSPFPSSWVEESAQSYADGLGSEEEELVTVEVGSPAVQKKSSPAGPLDQTGNRMERKLSPEPQGNKQESQDGKSQNLTTCEVCGACFETRKGLSSHARSHLRQLGVAESESSGAPIDLLYELAKQNKGKAENSKGANPSLPPGKKSGACKDGAGSPRPALLALGKPAERQSDPASGGTAIDDSSPPAFSPKSHLQPGSPLLRKASSALPASPPPKSAEDKSAKLPVSPLHNSPKSPWAQPDDEGPLNLTVDSDSGKDNDCQLCGAWFETKKGLSSHARAHLRHLGVTDPDAKGSPIEVLNDLIKSDEFKGHASSLLPGERKSLQGLGSPENPSPGSGAATASGAMGGGGGSGGSTVKQHSPLPQPRPLGKQPGSPLPRSSPPLKKIKSHPPPMLMGMRLQGKKNLSPEPYWAPSAAEMSPLNLSSGAEQEPARDIRCEFCGEYFENRKGLSSHARSHLRQMGITEWYVNGSPIDTLRDLLKRRSQPRGTPSSLGTGQAPSQGPGPKSMTKSEMRPLGALESHGSAQIRVPAVPKKVPHLGSPLARSPNSSPPTARKMFPGLSSSLQKKLKPDTMRVNFKPMMAGRLLNESPAASKGWAPHEEMSPLNLSFTDSRLSSPSASRTEPARDIRCEFCGEYFENRKGLSSHARSHLRQMGVTEWSVNGSPIDTLREIIRKKNKPCHIKKEPSMAEAEQQRRAAEERAIPKSPGKVLQAFPISSLAGKTGKPTASGLGRELHVSSPSSMPAKPQATFLTPIAAKRPLQDERLMQSEPKPKTYIQTELPFKFKVKSKSTQEKISSTSEACCELCGLYFENRKALASHARAHLRQFGVTEWCVNGSPIETLSEWIKHRPQKAGAYRSYIQGGRPFTKKFRRTSHSAEQDATGKRVPAPQLSSLVPVGKGLEKEPVQAEAGKDAGSAEDVPIASPAPPTETEELQRQSINLFERRQMKLPTPPNPRDEGSLDFQQKMEEVRQTPQRVRPVPSLVPRPPQTSLVKFVGNIYTLKCRFCDVEFQGPLSIQEEWVRHLQRHILDMNFSKASPRREASRTPDALAAAQ
ncbi:protein Wiz isoform X2 [Rhinatrema bivittatum]|uniref:protein Wiz isoform X2 n=1 Tax=Rhinatrema bivittatum TaxID=194408 RepID=UPI00112C23DC|nr:protein Wiz isoform X2 [Rhinatrema bivittatum]